MASAFRRILITTGSLAMVAFWVSCRSGTSLKTASAAAPVAAARTPSTVSTSVTIPRRSSFIAAMKPFHLDAVVLQQLVAAARPVYSLAKIQAGRTLTLVRTAAGELTALSYDIDLNHTLWLRAQPPTSPGGALTWQASIVTIPFTTTLISVAGTVQSSLFQAVEDAGAHDQLAVDMANIFGWDLDFYTDPRPGDVFKVMVEEHLLQGKFAGYGQIVAAEYVNAGHPYQAVRFHDREGFLAYFRPDGQPMKREFLKSPLKFDARVTSGFTYHRYHPILKIYRPHLGTDLAAPMGTPVQTIGAGVVVHAGWKGEDGRMVEIRHPNGYQTLYLHLSRVLVHVGEHVAQGERIGLVGMSGMATGPHLDFRIEHDGVFKNYEVFRKKLPPGLPVSARLMPQFQALCQRYMPELAKLQPASAPTQSASASH